MQGERGDQGGVRRLWAAVFGAEPPDGADDSVLIEQVIQASPPPGYGTLRRLGTILPHEPRSLRSDH